MPKKPLPSSSAAVEGSEPAIQVTAQQSRFHNDAVDAPTSKEILVKDLSIAIGQKELLNRTELFLKEGGHYVLVGRNGVGKSSKYYSLIPSRDISMIEMLQFPSLYSSICYRSRLSESKGSLSRTTIP
jgi:hypothetical protein